MARESRSASGSSGRGVLVILFGYPHTGVRVIYETLTPRISVDGEVVEEVRSWGEHRLTVAGGVRRCEVWVPASGLTFGRVARKIDIAPDVETFVVYEAPRTPGHAGSLDEIKTPGV